MIAFRLSLLLVCLVLSFAPRLRSQCSDPATPRAGFKVRFEQDVPVTFSDGYKTLANTLIPDATPGRCGWPLLVFVHGLGDNRNSPRVEAFALASGGFFIVSFDVRAQGDARALNPGRGSRLWAVEEWDDLAEIIEWADTKHPGLVDRDRVAVFGDSQGGLFAWAAAAYSGRRVPGSRRGTKAFPEIACVVPRFFTPDLPRLFVPDGASFFQHLPEFALATNKSGVLLDPGFRTKLAGFLDNGDPPGLESFLRSIPGKDFVSALEATQVPIFAVLGYRDTWTDPNFVFDLFARMPKSTPKRVYLTGGPHGEPGNVNLGFRYLFLTESWFRRFLKNDPDAVERGPEVLAASLPADRATLVDTQSLWPHRMEVEWPPADVRDERYHLRGQGRLTIEKAGFETPTSIQHVVPADYDVFRFRSDGGQVSAVLRSLLLSSAQWETAPFAEDREIAGLPSASFVVSPTHREYLFGVSLKAVAPDGEEVVLTRGGVAAKRIGTGTHRVDVKLGAVNAVVPAGFRLRLYVCNHDLQEPALTPREFQRIPFFHSYQVRVRHDLQTLSWVDVPMRPRVIVDLTTSETTVSVTEPRQQRLAIRSSADWRGAIYLVLTGFSGQAPATVLPSGSRLWLVPDAWTTTFSASINGPVQPRFAGLLDSRGGATPELNLAPIAPLPLSLVGAFMQLVPVTFTEQLGFHGGTPVRLRFR